MTRDAGFKRVVRRHAVATGQRYTEALTDLEGLGDRMRHEPVVDRLLDHLRERHGVDAVGATRLSVHNSVVFRIDRRGGDGGAEPWVLRTFPPARPREGAEGDAAVLRHLARHDFPAERLAVDDAVSELDGSAVLVTRFVEHRPFPDPTEKLALMADLLGRLHALPLDDSVRRPGGAEAGSDPAREGSPRQDLLAALAFLDSVATKVLPDERAGFERLRDRVRAADDATGLPEALVHGHLLHAPDHPLLTDRGVVGINWKGSGCGPRLSDLAWLLWGTHGDATAIVRIADAYRHHVEPTDEELDRLEAVMSIRPLYLTCFAYRRNVVAGGNEDALAYSDPAHLAAIAAAARDAFRR